MVERIIKLIDRLYELGYEVKVADRRPSANSFNLGSIALANDSEVVKLTAYLRNIVFYKSDSLKLSFDYLRICVENAERLDYIKKHGEYSKGAEDIASYILKKTT